MQGKTGSADLPLHGGRVPPWLASRMSRLGRVITEAIIHHHGRDEFLARLSHPFWFQSFGAVMGMDWHSSGITTSVMGALKRGLNPLEKELGLHICGGRGRHSRKTPTELLEVGERTGLDGAKLSMTSRLVAKVDSAAVHDGFQLYLHNFVVTDDGSWAVVQQGMNENKRQARRYHWFSQTVEDFVDEPHAAIEGMPQGTILNLTDHRAKDSREAQVELVQKPDQVLRHLSLPAHHEVRSADVNPKRLQATLTAAAKQAPKDFSELLMTKGLGARTVEALALVAEVIHGAPSHFSDPARFSYAHGGKDGHPFPVPIKVYDETIRILRSAIDKARLGNDDKLSAIERLDREAKRMERVVETGVNFDTLIAEERKRSGKYGGRTVFDDVGRSQSKARGGRQKQLKLF